MMMISITLVINNMYCRYSYKTRADGRRQCEAGGPRWHALPRLRGNIAYYVYIVRPNAI